MAAMFFMYQPFKSLTRTYTVLHQGLAGAERVFEILDEPPSITDKPDAKMAPRFAKAIEFHDVSFAYGAQAGAESNKSNHPSGRNGCIGGHERCREKHAGRFDSSFLRCERGRDYD